MRRHTFRSANRHRIVKSGRCFFRHRITPLNVCGNRQQPRGQVSVSRSGVCRATLQHSPVQVRRQPPTPGVYHQPQVQAPMPLPHPVRLAEHGHRPCRTHPPDEGHASYRQLLSPRRHHEARGQLPQPQPSAALAGVWSLSRGWTCCVLTASCSRRQFRDGPQPRRSRRRWSISQGWSTAYSGLRRRHPPQVARRVYAG